MPPQADVSILLKAVDGSWTRIGADGSRGIVPEGLSLSANESGPDTCSFSLRRVARLPWPDLLAFNQCEVWIGGTLVWGGRIWEAPLSDAEEDVIAVQGRGWQYHLDDDLLQRTYVHTRLSDWRDTRTFPSTNLSFYSSNGSVASDRGAIVLQWGSGVSLGSGTRVAVTLDFGSNSEGPERAVIQYETIADTTSILLYVRSHDFESETDSETAGAESDAVAAASFTALGRSGTTSGTFAAKRRYVTILIVYTGGTFTTAQDWWLRLLSVKMFRDTAYESGNASILKASDVVEDVLSSGAVPLLDSTTDAIEASSFSIPDFAPQGRQTPRALVEAVNAYEGNLTGVDARRRLFFRERPTAALLEVGEWSGSAFQDGSTNSGEGLYSRVIVQATGPDGSLIEAARYASNVGSTEVADTGLVTNTGFETDTSGWTEVLDGSITRTNSQAYEGTWSAILQTGPSEWVAVDHTIASIPAGTYELHFAFFDNDPGELTVSIFRSGDLINFGAAGPYILINAATWQAYVVGFTVPSTGAATIRIQAHSTTSTQVGYIDAIRVFGEPAGLMTRQGFHRTAVLPVSSALTAAAAEQIGDLWLGERILPPFKGSMTVNGNGCRRAMGGSIHPSELLLQVGERIRFGHLPDPTTGASAREGTIKSVSYNHDEQAASVELDNERGRLTALLERLAVVTGQIAG